MSIEQEKTDFELAIYLVYIRSDHTISEILNFPAKEVIDTASDIPQEQITVAEMRDILTIRKHGLDYLLKNKSHLKNDKIFNKFDVMDV